MRVLREQEAFSYLNRLEVCVSSFDRQDYRLLQMMVRMQRVYFETLMEDREPNPEFAGISINSTGFPELPSWLGDIRRGGIAFNEIRQRRVDALLPVLQEVSQEQLTLSAEALTAQLSKDNILTAVFGQDRDKEQEDLYKKIMSGNKKLSVKEPDNRTKGFLRVTFKENYSKFEYLAKYLDDPKENKPLLLCFWRGQDISGSDYLGHPANGGGKDGGILGNKGIDAEYSNLRFPLRKSLVEADYSEGGKYQFCLDLYEITHFNSLLDSFKAHCSTLMTGKSLDSASYGPQLELINYQLRVALANASTVEVQRLFEECLKEELSSIEGESKDISVGAKGLVVRRFDRSSSFGRAWRFLHRW